MKWKITFSAATTKNAHEVKYIIIDFFRRLTTVLTFLAVPSKLSLKQVRIQKMDVKSCSKWTKYIWLTKTFFYIIYWKLHCSLLVATPAARSAIFSGYSNDAKRMSFDGNLPQYGTSPLGFTSGLTGGMPIHTYQILVGKDRYMHTKAIYC